MDAILVSVGVCLAIAGLGAATSLQRRRSRFRAARELGIQASSWRLLRTPEELHAAAERALEFERERAREASERLSREQLKLEHLAARSASDGQPMADVVCLAGAAEQHRLDPEAA